MKRELFAMLAFSSEGKLIDWLSGYELDKVKNELVLHATQGNTTMLMTSEEFSRNVPRKFLEGFNYCKFSAQPTDLQDARKAFGLK